MAFLLVCVCLRTFSFRMLLHPGTDCIASLSKFYFFFWFLQMRKTDKPRDTFSSFLFFLLLLFLVLVSYVCVLCFRFLFSTLSTVIVCRIHYFDCFLGFFFLFIRCELLLTCVCAHKLDVCHAYQILWQRLSWSAVLLDLRSHP